MAELRRTPGTLAWTALGLLSISVAINYIDRGNLSVALSSIERDIHIDQHALGVLSMAFFLSYSLLQIGAAKLIERFNVIWVYAAGYLLWSLVTAATGAVKDIHIAGLQIGNFATLFALRVLLGAGECVAYPSYSKIISGIFPETLRGTANAAIDVGTKIGPAAGVLVSATLLQVYGWRGMFISLGIASLVWLVPWFFAGRRLQITQDEIKAAPPAYQQIMRQRPFWGTVFGLFGGNYAWYFMLTWLPYYFEHERHYAPERLALMSSLPFWVVGVSCMLAGLGTDGFIRRGASPVRVRQATVSAGLAGCCIFMFGTIMAPSETASLLSLLGASLCFGLFSGNHWAFTQSLSGELAAGKWTGLQNCFGNFSGIVAPWLTGFTLQYTHSFSSAFLLTCAALLVGITGYWFVVGKSGTVTWESAPPRPAQLATPFES